MDERLTYNEFQEWTRDFKFRSESDNYKFEYIVPRINELIYPDDVLVFYPRNLFEKEIDSELLFVKENKIIFVSGDESNLLFKEFKFSEMVDYDFELFKEPSGVENVRLNIRFSNDRHLYFDSLGDSNVHWRPVFVKKLKEVYKLIVSK